ncbi:MAG: UDP-4-amino-4,6-dideoxy-N-acetyl-beta-L-altrosamine transaminase [Anaerolineales bacterium]|nr:UDP-4-amino-4,6-dideoxy-N-acetyl-beta-L-altrosamine transaminase [Chloroflexota bacterium]MBL6980162.1 UDP-4-amino-4,6-dideoxy-N-acetyl-beta-L-altrosamine transaminase [Anaerolineales bacterium]
MPNLAIKGGRPVRGELLPYGRQMVDDGDIDAVVEVLRSEWLTTGPNIENFENAFAQRVGAKYAVAVSSGTAALHSAIFAAGIKPGDEVVVPAMTFAASANCVRYQGGTVVFVDVNPHTLNIDPACVEAAITSRTRAIITVDYTGQPSDLDEINTIAEQNNLMVIEDGSHALGASYRGRTVGYLTDMTTFSLHPVKHITTGEGGVISTDDPELANSMMIFRNHGITSEHRQRETGRSWFYEMEHLGYNYRLTDFQCALGNSQLKKLDSNLARRQKIAAMYQNAFNVLREVEPLNMLPDRMSAWHLFVVQLNLELLSVNRTQIYQALRAENIGVNVHYIPVPWHPYYRKLGYKKGQWPIAEAAYERILTLPMFPSMSDEDIDDVILAVEKVVDAYRN